jgi:ribulose-phosphate 3-epimerase
MNIPIVPAIIPDSAADVRSRAKQLAFSPEIHIDVVDGKFVPYRSWPYSPPGDPREVKNDTDRFTLEVDLMVADPLFAAEAWLAAGADMLVFHIETLAVEELEAFAKTARVSIGVSALNDTPLEALSPYLACADYVQVMGIAAIGAQGRPFDERALARLARLKAEAPTRLVSVDGGVNRATVKRLVAAGAERLVAGSAIIAAALPEAAARELRELSHQQQ